VSICAALRGALRGERQRVSESTGETPLFAAITITCPATQREAQQRREIQSSLRSAALVETAFNDIQHSMARVL